MSLTTTTNEKSQPGLEDGHVGLEDLIVEGAHWQVVGPRPFPTNGRAGTSTETYAAGIPRDPTVSWVVDAARKQLEQQRAGQ